MHVHFTCIFLSFSGPLTVWSVSVTGCLLLLSGSVLSKVVELAGVETAGTSYAKACRLAGELPIVRVLNYFQPLPILRVY